MKKDILIITRKTEDSILYGQKLANEYGYYWENGNAMKLKDCYLDTCKDAVVLCLNSKEGFMTYCEYEYFFDENNKPYSRFEKFTIMDVRSRNVMETE